MGRKCRKCNQRTGPNRRLCKMCSLDKRYGTGFERGSDVGEPDELEYRCVACTHEQVCTLSDECEECGERRWRYIGPLPGEEAEREVAADGGLEEIYSRRTISQCECGDIAIGDCPCLNGGGSGE